MTGPEHDDVLADAIALVETVLSDNTAGFGAVVRNADHPRVTVILSKLLAELLIDNDQGYGCCSECFRSWALRAVERNLAVCP